jgi:hypothetical protein
VTSATAVEPGAAEDHEAVDSSTGENHEAPHDLIEAVAGETLRPA